MEIISDGLVIRLKYTRHGFHSRTGPFLDFVLQLFETGAYFEIWRKKRQKLGYSILTCKYFSNWV